MPGCVGHTQRGPARGDIALSSQTAPECRARPRGSRRVRAASSAPAQRLLHAISSQQAGRPSCQLARRPARQTASLPVVVCFVETINDSLAQTTLRFLQRGAEQSSSIMNEVDWADVWGSSSLISAGRRSLPRALEQQIGGFRGSL